MFARFDENPAMTLQDIKKTKRYGQTDRRTRMDNMKTVYPPQTKFAGGFKILRKQNVTEGRTHTHRQRENSIPTTNKVCRGYNEKSQ